MASPLVVVSGESPAFDDERSFDFECELTAAWMHRHVGRPAAAFVPHLDQPAKASSAITAIPHEISIV